jgi:hypothetical protein
MPNNSMFSRIFFVDMSGKFLRVFHFTIVYTPLCSVSKSNETGSNLGKWGCPISRQTQMLQLLDAMIPLYNIYTVYTIYTVYIYTMMFMFFG